MLPVFIYFLAFLFSGAAGKSRPTGGKRRRGTSATQQREFKNCDVTEPPETPAWLGMASDGLLWGIDTTVNAVTRVPVPAELVAGLTLPGLGDDSANQINELFEIAGCLNGAIDNLDNRVKILEEHFTRAVEHTCTGHEISVEFDLKEIAREAEDVKAVIGTQRTSKCGISRTGGVTSFPTGCNDYVFEHKVMRKLKGVFEKTAEFIARADNAMDTCFTCNGQTHHSFTFEYAPRDCTCTGEADKSLCRGVGRNPGHCTLNKKEKTSSVVECNTKWDEDSYIDAFYIPVVQAVNLAMNVWAEATMMGRARDEISFYYLMDVTDVMTAFINIATKLSDFRGRTHNHRYWNTINLGNPQLRGGNSNINAPLIGSNVVPFGCSNNLTPGYTFQFQSRYSHEFPGTRTATCVGNLHKARDRITRQLEGYERELRDMHSDTLGITHYFSVVGDCDVGSMHLLPRSSSSDGYNERVHDSDAKTACVSSRNYPEKHGNNEECFVTVLRSATVTPSVTFVFEPGYDTLSTSQIDIRASHQVPQTMSSGEVLHWRSDGSVTNKGWQLCFSAHQTPTRPTPTQSHCPEYEFVHDGHCNGGWMSPNTNQGSLNGCYDKCKPRGAGFFAWNSVTSSCSCYTESGGCPDDNRYPDHNAYRINDCANPSASVALGRQSRVASKSFSIQNMPRTQASAYLFACIGFIWIMRTFYLTCLKHEYAAIEERASPEEI